jgi:hypothetical protein
MGDASWQAGELAQQDRGALRKGHGEAGRAKGREDESGPDAGAPFLAGDELVDVVDLAADAAAAGSRLPFEIGSDRESQAGHGRGPDLASIPAFSCQNETKRRSWRTRLNSGATGSIFDFLTLT